ncbi:MFS transporter [Rhodococcoides trifolii]|uniref:MFS transporter n=1 Tax=Rhodococcoides trifolii TaxID=908250 RepID=A0A917D4S9_9NOCA|nr:MFS transporter [Rhodococcus trifolii]GGG11837.1 MFS transporter [Rhodococcus trifolii]
MIMGAASFGGFGLLLPVVPLVISQNGGSDALAGATTAVFMGATVATQLGVPWLLRTVGHRGVLAAGCLLLGLPALAFLLSTAPPAVLTISAFRGVGFGLLTVSSAALVAELAPSSLLGRATGAQGIAVAVAQMIALPTGLALLQSVSASAVFLVGALVPVVALVAILRLPAVRSAPEARTSGGAFEWQRLVLPCVAIASVSAAFGGLSSLLPIAESDSPVLAGLALSVVSGAMIVGRYGAGAIADRVGPGRALVPALVVTTVGVLAFAAGVAGAGSAAVLLAAAVVFGVGYGACQNESLVMAFAYAGPTRFGVASAAWNISFDAGTGVGALALGVLAVHYGYSTTFALGSALVLVVAVLVRSSTWRR